MIYYKKGNTTRQAHVDIPEGTVEEEFGRGGFFGRASHIYRRKPPVNWVDIDGDCRPEAFSCDDVAGQAPAGDYLARRVPVLRNDDVTLSYARISEPMGYHFRNADGDDTLFVHRGAGTIETDFGPLEYEQGDYLVIPRGTVYRLAPTDETALLVIETREEITVPDRGILGKHALFDPEVIRVPEPVEPAGEAGRDRWQLKIKRANRLTTVTYPFNPIQTVGWRGDLTVWQLNVRDIRPISSERYHLPPTAHATFVVPSNNVVICSFLPRPLETGDPGALKVPFYHANIDYDEVLFYHDGNFFSREGIDAGMITFHPQGIHHGPQPGAVDAAVDKTRTDEKAVMVDTRNPLQLTEAARNVANPDYWKSWMAE